MLIEFKCTNCKEDYEVYESSKDMDMQWIEVDNAFGYEYVARCPHCQKANIVSVK